MVLLSDRCFDYCPIMLLEMRGNEWHLSCLKTVFRDRFAASELVPDSGNVKGEGLPLTLTSGYSSVRMSAHSLALAAALALTVLMLLIAAAPTTGAARFCHLAMLALFGAGIAVLVAVTLLRGHAVFALALCAVTLCALTLCARAFAVLHAAMHSALHVLAGAGLLTGGGVNGEGRSAKRQCRTDCNQPFLRGDHDVSFSVLMNGYCAFDLGLLM
jgi:hypothetical protein